MTRIILLSLLAIALAACSTPPQRAAQTPSFYLRWRAPTPRSMPPWRAT